MKRKAFYILAITLTIIITGCGKKEMKSLIQLKKGAFTITCTDKDTDETMSREGLSIYNFNDEQYAVNYSITTTQKFKDNETYKMYKDAQEESVDSMSSDTLKIKVKSDDKNKILVHTMAITEIDVNDATSEEEKERLKASNILKSSEKSKMTCKVEGIDKNKLK